MGEGASLVIDIASESRLWDGAGAVDALIERAILAAVEVGRIELLADAELSIVLADDAGIRKLNKAWRAKDSATNVLSFPAAPPERIAFSPMLGDIVLAYETIEREAVALGIAFEAHLSHLLVHGFLHLLGFDHHTDAEAGEMESLERLILERLGIADPYAEQSPLRAAS